MTDSFGSKFSNLMTHSNVFYDTAISTTTPLGIIGVQFELTAIQKLFDPVRLSCHIDILQLVSYGPYAKYVVYSPTELKGFINGQNDLSSAKITTNINEFEITDDYIKQLYSDFDS